MMASTRSRPSAAPLAIVAAFASLLVACPSGPTPTPTPPPSPSASASPPLVIAPMPAPSVDAAASVTAPSGVASATCTRDDDCVASTFPGCCECCPCAPIRAFTRAAEDERKAACARKKCEECPPLETLTCPSCRDPRNEGMVARCQSGACVIVETAAAPVTCRTTDDCWFDDAYKPIARPPKLRGKKITPCKSGGEHAPACENGVCIVRVYKC